MSFRDTKAEMGHVEEVSSETSHSNHGRRTFGQRVKSHYRRFWWAHLIFLVVCVLVIVLPLVYVGFPRIAQQDIDRSSLAVNSLMVTAPTATTFHLRQNATVINKSSYHPRLDAFNATLALHGGEPYATVELPAIHATSQAPSIADQTVTITNMEAFMAYNEAVLGSAEVQVDIKGRTGLHEMSLPTTQVNYDKTATVKGLNSFSGFNVTSFSIMLTPDPDGTNMVGEVYIPNASDMTIAFGNLTFNNTIPATGGKPAMLIGNTTLHNVVLTPGNNTIPMRSIIDQTAVIESLTTNFKNGMLPIDIVGSEVVYNGQHLSYYEKPFQGLTQHITLNVGAALKAIGVDPSALAGLGGGSTH